MITQFSKDLAFKLANYSTFRKGEEYFSDGLVRKLWQEGDKYQASVQGTHRYTVSIQIKDDEVKTDCTCPYDLGGICKHTVAAILAFATSKQYSLIKIDKKDNKEEKLLEELLGKASHSQIRIFLKKTLKENPDLINDLQIFLQGTKKTPVSVFDYQKRFRQELDELDLDGLLQAWYHSGEDYYDGYYEGEYDEETLPDLVANFVAEAQKYASNQNYAESLKIYQAALEALGEKDRSLTGDETELSDWFVAEMEKVFNNYITILTETNDQELKLISIGYLCRLFEEEPFALGQASMLAAIKKVVIDKNLAQVALNALKKTQIKADLSIAESSLLAYLYYRTSDFQSFVKVSKDYLDKNPQLCLNLLKYYQDNNRKKDVLITAKHFLGKISKTNRAEDPYFWADLGKQELEVNIRRFLTGIFQPKEDYQEMIANFEQLFLLTKIIPDYEALTKAYQSREEKESFFGKMKQQFRKEQEIKTLFKVFRLEDKKEEILDLIRQFPNDGCYPDMVAFVAKTYPGECFASYKRKMEGMLKVADVDIYPQVAYHLQKMKLIGLTNEFHSFLAFIKTNFWRRKRLIEELEKNKLL